MSKEIQGEAGYQGFTTYPTWAVSVWISNDFQIYNEWRDKAKQAMLNAQDDKEKATLILADQLKEWVNENNPLNGTIHSWAKGMYCDILGAALGDVNYRELAQDLLSE